MAGIIQIITLILLSLLMMSSSCDKGSEGCTDSNACNYDDTAAINDNSCWFASEGCYCDDPSGSIIDCLEICDADANNNPPVDSDGNCCASLDEDCEVIVVGGCIEEGNCNYDPNATHNDGTCAGDLSEFGGLLDGNDCNGECGGFAVEDECGLCIGGSTNLGQSWRIKINSIATFKLQDGTSMGADTNSVILGTSIFALDGYNDEVLSDSNTLMKVAQKFVSVKPIKAKNTQEREKLWQGRKHAAGAMGMLSPAYYTNDGVVPRHRFTEILERIYKIGEKYNLEIANLCHAGDGNIHPLILYDPKKNNQIKELRIWSKKMENYPIIFISI